MTLRMLSLRYTPKPSSWLQLNREISHKNQLAISENFVNRNPRNLERMRIGYKPDGYHVDRPEKNFWHKLQLAESGRYVTATVQHFQNGPVVEVSTNEWALKRQLYKGNDVSAYYNLGRVLADRCLKSGLNEICCDLKQSKEKVVQFVKALQEGGLVLEEASQFKPSRPWDLYRPEKPWEVHE